MGVNRSACVYYFVRQRQKTIFNFVMPAAGFFICLLLSCGLSWHARLLGIVRMAAGIGTRKASAATW